MLFRSETVNNVRRIYTDGRDHPPAEERFPLYYGDSIGVWDGPRLIVHTTQLIDRSMGRNQPTQSEKMETVEIWRKVDAKTVVADVWLYDPAIYTDETVAFRQFVCPGCATLLETEIAIAGAPPQWDIRPA